MKQQTSKQTERTNRQQTNEINIEKLMKMLPELVQNGVIECRKWCHWGPKQVNFGPQEGLGSSMRVKVGPRWPPDPPRWPREHLHNSRQFKKRTGGGEPLWGCSESLRTLQDNLGRFRRIPNTIQKIIEFPSSRRHQALIEFNICMYTCTHMYMYTCAHVYMYTCINAYMFTIYMYTFIYA